MCETKRADGERMVFFGEGARVTLGTGIYLLCGKGTYCLELTGLDDEPPKSHAQVFRREH